ncbi:MAG: 1-acyl-sn-glycerol-3-phosphate acyltransferase [Rhodocyclales bacterium]|nr:1-acyl-sn-glycerol-3-phosphate acyltransferase [Rhodocyclales bacterium]
MQPGWFGRLCAALLRLFGWRVRLVWPPVPKAVVIVYPHTSNWDFVVGILARYAIAIPIRFVGKDTLFRWPFGGLFRRLGGIPVDRRRSSGFVGGLIEAFDKADSLYLAIAPEGTRSKVDHWKSGFYRLALAARVPLGLAFIDYSRREVGIEVWLSLSGNEAEDLAAIRAYYADKRGKRPGKEGSIRFR